MSQSDEVKTAPARQQDNARMLGKLLIVVCLMFGFGWALVPFYEKICELTGINVLARKDNPELEAREFAKNTQVDTSRSISVEFDANVQGPWRFKPVVNSMKVHPGELTTITYEIVNASDTQSVGQAIPSYAPKLAERFFKKLECFCFRQQSLGPKESRRFPVVFVIDPAIPKDVDVITLSYTFFEVAGSTAPAAPDKPKS